MTNDKSIEYAEIPLEASHTSTEKCAYGTHLVPLSASTDLGLPEIIPQSLEGDVLPLNECEKWGRVNRSERCKFWSHYCTDAKFATLLRNPDLLIATGCDYTTEVNISSYEEDPLPIALSQLFRKRCVTRVWQDAGIKVFIDLHVSGITRDLVFDGVSPQHELFCTRYKARDLSGDYLGMEAVYDDFDLVSGFVDEDVTPTFLVYGVPETKKKECEANGWLCISPITNRSRKEVN